MSKNIVVRSEEVQAIMERIPHWMIRYGNLIIFAVLLLVFSLSYFIPYPSVVKAEVIITTANGPEKIIAKSTGIIEKLLIKNGDPINVNQAIAIVENNANYEDIFKLRKAITLNDNLSSFPVYEFKNRNLGEIEQTYAIFENLYYSTIKNNNAISSHSLTNSINALKNAIDNWEFKYVIKAKISGRISFINIWSDNQSVSQGDIIFAVIPKYKSEYVGKAKINVKDSGKIKMGQAINIHLDNYPDFEYGIIKGKVASITEIPDKDGNIWLNIKLSNNIKTSYSKSIDFKHEMSGRGDIIIKNMTLLQRLLYQFRSID